MLKVHALSGGYGRARVLFDIGFEVNEGEVVCLLGRNGMGKTTTIKTLMGLLPTWSGDVEFNGARLTGQSASRIARLGLGLVPEGRQIFPNLSVHENLIATAANRAFERNPWNVARIYDLFPGLQERRSSAGSLLSGGEQQMLAIGRALMTNPKLLILDEATEGLAPVIRDQIWACLGRLRQEGQSIIIVDKHIKKLAALADRFYVIDKGRIPFQCRPSDLSADHSELTRYLAV